MRPKLKLRRMVPQDLPAVWKYCHEQNQRDGTNYPVPEIFDAEGQLLPNVALALVTVDDAGKVYAGHVFERTLEYMGFGGDARAIKVSMDEAPGVYYVLRALGYKNLHIQPPKAHADQLEKALTDRMGMARDDDKLAHFYRDL